MRRLCRISIGDSTMLSTVAASSGCTSAGIRQIAPQQQRQQREAELSALRHHDARAQRLEPALGRRLRHHGDHRGLEQQHAGEDRRDQQQGVAATAGRRATCLP